MAAAAFTGTVDIDGIKYSLSTKTERADAIGLSDAGLTGTLEIPGTVVYEGVTYHVESVGGFSSCSGITSLKIGEGISRIEEAAFKDCTSLQTVDLPSSIVRVHRYAFDGTAWLDGSPDGVVYLGDIAYTYKGDMPEGTELAIQEGTRVISVQCFYLQEHLKSVSFPSSLKIINDGAFANCTSLEGIVLNDLAVGFESFAGCPSLKSVSMTNVDYIGETYDPKHVREFGTSDVSGPEYCFSCFYVTYNIEKVFIDNKVVGNWFSSKAKLKTATLGNHVEQLTEDAFQFCSELTAIEIPVSVRILSGFRYSGLTSITIPSSVEEIGVRAFQECKDLVSVSLPEGLRKIGDDAFRETPVTTVDIPGTVSSIGNNCFYGCRELTSITLPDKLDYLGTGVFSACIGLKEISLPEGPTSVGDQMFFKNIKLESVTLPSTITDIGDNAFAYTTELTDLYCYAPIPPLLGKDSFKESSIEYATLHVPTSSVADYQAAWVWKDFKNIVAIPGTVSEKCAAPTISYADGKLTFACATEGARFFSAITDPDIKESDQSEIALSATYHISVYATAPGCSRSNTIIATLCWIDAGPRVETIDEIAEVRAVPVLIEARGGAVSVKGVSDGTGIDVYNLSGQMVASASAHSTCTAIPTGLRKGETAIVKIANRTVKVIMQ